MIINGHPYVRRTIEFDSEEQADRATYQLGMLCCNLARSFKTDKYLLTARECVHLLDYDGDYIIWP